MNCTVERATLVRMVKQLKGGDERLRLWACVARVFVESNGVIAGTEALVFEDGSCVVPRVTFLKLLQSYAGDANITIQADAMTMRVGTVTISSVGYTSQAAPPAKFHVFPVTDTWIVAKNQAAVGAGSPDPFPAQNATTVVPVPPPPTFQTDAKGVTWVVFTCGACGMKFRAKAGKEGKEFTCPQCGSSVRIPLEKPPAPSGAEGPASVPSGEGAALAGQITPTPASAPSPMSQPSHAATHPPNLHQAKNVFLVYPETAPWSENPTSKVLAAIAAAKKEQEAQGHAAEKAAEVAAPAATGILFDCPHCGQHIEADAAMAQMQAVCPTCGNQLKVPNVTKTPKTVAGEAPKVAATTATTASAARTAKASDTPQNGRSEMNLAQKRVAFIGIVLFTLIGLFPPWTYTIDLQSMHSERPAGSYFLFDPPAPRVLDTPSLGVQWGSGVKLDVSSLAVRWVLVATVTCGLILVLRGKPL